MASIGDISLAVFSGEQKTSLSAASINFDFTLVKIPAPIEYQGLGKSLSLRRRNEAEDGALHVVARRLGSLFAPEIPAVPNLISAYGKRTSEISENPKANPVASRTFGIFSEHVGADGTSLWAAATSGKNTVTIHLLACMLARIWTPTEATSLWVEIVATRKELLRKRLEEDEFHMAELAGSRIEISREELAAWDNSARSWLRSADSACEHYQKDLLVVINQLKSEVNRRSSVYSTVMEWWRQGMEILENLISGIPQSVQTSEILLPLSSWHLYPDVVLVSDRTLHVRQGDVLIASGGIMTIGLHGPPSSPEPGVSWSLPLSHLRYYGKPVDATRGLNICNARINFEQLTFLTLGSLTRGWQGGIDAVLKFFFALAQPWRILGVPMPNWLRLLHEAAQWYTSLEGRSKEEAGQLFNFGRRRCGTFLSSQGQRIPQFFGLCNPSNLLLAIGTSEGRIAWLREYCSKQGLFANTRGSTVIKYCPEPDWEANHEKMSGSQEGTSDSQITGCRSKTHGRHPDKDPPTSKEEFASLFPWIEGPDQVHMRWIPANEGMPTRHPILINQDCRWEIPGFVSPSTAMVERTRQLGRDTSEKCGMFHSTCLPISGDPSGISGYTRYPHSAPIQPLQLHQVPTAALVSEPEFTDLHLLDQTRLGGHDRPIKRRKSDRAIGCSGKWYLPQMDPDILQSPPDGLHCVFGDFETAAVYVPRRYMHDLEFSDSESTTRELLKHLLDVDYVCGLLDKGFVSVIGLTELLGSPRKIWGFDPDSILTSLNNLIAASAIYRDLPNSTIDIGVTSKPLSYAKWWAAGSTSLAKYFSCIAMFENGGLSVNPVDLKRVIAISSGNSLYIAAQLLHDPCQDGNKRRPPIVHTVGNVGKIGMCFLITPEEAPLVYEPERDKWQLVRHALFDGRLESNFTATSLHLSFTGYEFPIRTSDHGGFDAEVFFVQSVVRAFDKGKWIADLDILGSYARLREGSDYIHQLSSAPCSHSIEEQNQFDDSNLISVDSWIECLDAPTTDFIVRAKGDWISRLALFSVAVQSRQPLVIARDQVCWACVAQAAAEMAFRKYPPEDMEKDSNQSKLMILC